VRAAAAGAIRRDGLVVGTGNSFVLEPVSVEAQSGQCRLVGLELSSHCSPGIATRTTSVATATERSIKSELATRPPSGPEFVKPIVRKFLGFSFTSGKESRRCIAPPRSSIKARVRELTQRTRGQRQTVPIAPRRNLARLNAAPLANPPNSLKR
jgi:hypothetical protein